MQLDNEHSTIRALTSHEKEELKNGLKEYLRRLEKSLKDNTDLNVNEYISSFLKELLKEKFDTPEVNNMFTGKKVDETAVLMLKNVMSNNLAFFLEAIHFSRGYLEGVSIVSYFSTENALDPIINKGLALRKEMQSFIRKFIEEEVNRRKNIRYTLDIENPYSSNLYAFLNSQETQSNEQQRKKTSQEIIYPQGLKANTSWQNEQVQFPMRTPEYFVNSQDYPAYSVPGKILYFDQIKRNEQFLRAGNPFIGTLMERNPTPAIIPTNSISIQTLVQTQVETPSTELDSAPPEINNILEDIANQHGDIPAPSLPERERVEPQAMALEHRSSEEEMLKIADGVYAKLMNILLERIAGFNQPASYQKQHFIPFIKSIKEFNGGFCMPLPFNDANKVIKVIKTEVEKIEMSTEFGDLFCANVKRFFTDFNVFFFNSYRRTGFPFVKLLNSLDETITEDSKEFKFDLQNSDIKLLCLESEILEISRANHEAALKAKNAATGVHEIVIQTLIYNQAEIVLNVPANVSNDDPDYWLICLLQLPSEGRKVKDVPDLKPSDTVARLLLARAKSTNRLDAFFEISKLKRESEEYPIALNMISSMSRKLQDLFLVQGDEYNTEDLITNNYTKLSQQQLHEVIAELTENVNLDSKILPLLAVEKSNSQLPISKKPPEETDTPNGKRKRKETSNKSKLESVKVNIPSKKPKRTHRRSDETQSIQDTVTAIRNKPAPTSFSRLFDYLNNKQQSNIRKVARLADKVTRAYTLNFNFEKMQMPNLLPLEVVEQEKLNQFLESTSLYPYQKEGVIKIITAERCNEGLLLADEMSLGKTLQIGAALRYLSQTDNKTAYLVVVPLSVLEKWRNELTTKLSFAESEVIVFHGEARTIDAETFNTNKVVITTYETLLSELKQLKPTVLKTALGYISKFNFINIPDKNIEAWSTVVAELEVSVGKEIIKKSENGKHVKFLRFPNNDELKLLRLRSKISEINLKNLFSSELIFQYLNKLGYINKYGGILRSMVTEDELNNLYKIFPELTFSQKDLFQAFQKADDSFALKGIILDEGHHMKNDNLTFAYLFSVAKMVAKRRGLRCVLTGTPFQNKIKEVWTLFEFLNPGRLLSENEFTAAYDSILENSGTSICDAAELIQTGGLDQFNERLKTSVDIIKSSYNELQKVIDLFQERQIRRTKKYIETLSPQQGGPSNTYRRPVRLDDDLPWAFSPLQTELYDKLDKSAIEAACRGFAFAREHAQVTIPAHRSEKGSTLLMRLAQIFDHPILVSEKHKGKLFYKNRKYHELIEYLSEVVKTDYDNDIYKFIEESGKLSQLIEAIIPLLSTTGTRILISAGFIPMVAILDFVISQVSGIQSLVYSGGDSKQSREILMEEFNKVTLDPENDLPRVIIVSQKAGSEGIDLFANYVFCYDQTWTDAQSEQMKARADRNGSPYTEIKCISFVGNNPLDLKMSNFVREKREMGNWIVNRAPECTINWFLDRLRHIIVTSPLFAAQKEKIPDDKLDQAISQIKDQLRMDQDLSLDQLRPIVRLATTITTTTTSMNSEDQSEEVPLERRPSNRTDTSITAMEVANTSNSEVEKQNAITESQTDPMQVEQATSNTPVTQEFSDFNTLVEACNHLGFFAPTNTHSPVQNVVANSEEHPDPSSDMQFNG